ncbi:molybdenum cofactor guanylyltransferase [Ochrobactrum sp. CM-21-5]|nr:molybdenum cofactor guanylyltransferase MobA [Ochrobactrum sp. CM-21-5]MBC2886778.1 molybdenum cofactor guanylyltransferase [Ochrobactrum sp. CM-21-5]
MTEERRKIAAAIIAGGQSSRMQAGGIPGDKFLQPLGSRPLIAHVIERLSSQVDYLFINANGAPSRFAPWALPVISDKPAPHGGPLAGLLTALDHARHFPVLLTAAADAPFLPADLVERLYRRHAKTDARIVIACSDNRLHPIVGLWRTDLVDELRDWLANAPKASVLAFASQIGFDTVNFALAPLAGQQETYDPFFNINRPDDLIKAQRLNEALH